VTIFALDASGKTSSVAILRDHKVIVESFIDEGLTHSETLLTQVDKAFNTAQIIPKDIDYYTVTTGPGSFTGLRIGIATIKGLAFPLDTPCVAVSTLEAMARDIEAAEDTVIVPVIDARRDRVYVAAYTMQFHLEKATYKKILDETILTLEQLKDITKGYLKPVMFVGEMWEKCYDYCKDTINCIPQPEGSGYIRGEIVATIAEQKIAKKEYTSSSSLVPVYMQLSQAEREKLDGKVKKDDSISR